MRWGLVNPPPSHKLSLPRWCTNELRSSSNANLSAMWSTKPSLSAPPSIWPTIRLCWLSTWWCMHCSCFRRSSLTLIFISLFSYIFDTFNTQIFHLNWPTMNSNHLLLALIGALAIANLLSAEEPKDEQSPSTKKDLDSLQNVYKYSNKTKFSHNLRMVLQLDEKTLKINDSLIYSFSEFDQLRSRSTRNLVMTKDETDPAKFIFVLKREKIIAGRAIKFFGMFWVSRIFYDRPTDRLVLQLTNWSSRSSPQWPDFLINVILFSLFVISSIIFLNRFELIHSTDPRCLLESIDCGICISG